MHRGRALSRKGLGRGAGGKQMAGEAGLHDHQGSRVFRSQRPGAGAGIRARLWPWPRPHREKFAEGNGRAPVRTPEEMLDQSAIAMQQTCPSSVRLETTGVCPYPWCRGSAGSSAALGWPGRCRPDSLMLQRSADSLAGVWLPQSWHYGCALGEMPLCVCVN